MQGRPGVNIYLEYTQFKVLFWIYSYSLCNEMHGDIMHMQHWLEVKPEEGMNKYIYKSIFKIKQRNK